MREVDIHSMREKERGKTNKRRKSCKHVVNLCRKFHVRNYQIKSAETQTKTTVHCCTADVEPVNKRMSRSRSGQKIKGKKQKQKRLACQFQRAM